LVKLLNSVVFCLGEAVELGYFLPW